MNSLRTALLLLVVLTLGAPASGAAAGDLTPRQREIWEKTKARLEQVYAAKKIIPAPMSEAEIRTIRVPLVCANPLSGDLPWNLRLAEALGHSAYVGPTGPLPWDAQLLLGFDRNLKMHDGDATFFDFILASKHQIFTPDGLLGLFADLGSMLSEEPLDLKKAKRVFLARAKGLPMVLNLPQLGGDEIPGLWLARTPLGCTPVLHFDYDDFPEFYLRNACLLDYVSIYVGEDWEEHWGGGMRDGLMFGERMILSPEESQAALEALKPQLELLNKAVEDALMILAEEDEEN